jgi:hypothetical protein
MLVFSEWVSPFEGKEEVKKKKSINLGVFETF